MAERQGLRAALARSRWETLRARLADVMVREHLSLRRAAADIGCTHGALHMWLAGRVTPHPANRSRLARWVDRVELRHEKAAGDTRTNRISGQRISVKREQLLAQLNDVDLEIAARELRLDDEILPYLEYQVAR